MIGYMDIKGAVVRKLREKLQEVPVADTGIEIEFERPTFFVQLLPKMEKVYDTYCDKVLIVNIHYFSEEETDAASVIMLDKLNKIFGNVISVKDRVLTLSNKHPLIQEKELQFQFELAFTEALEGIEESENYFSELEESLGYSQEKVQTMKELQINEKEGI